MPSKINQVRAALVKCEAWYVNYGADIRLLTERTEELWFQIDDIVCILQEAEILGNKGEAERCVEALLRCALALRTEVQEFYSKNRK